MQTKTAKEIFVENRNLNKLSNKELAHITRSVETSIEKLVANSYDRQPSFQQMYLLYFALNKSRRKVTRELQRYVFSISSRALAWAKRNKHPTNQNMELIGEIATRTKRFFIYKSEICSIKQIAEKTGHHRNSLSMLLRFTENNSDVTEKVSQIKKMRPKFYND